MYELKFEPVFREDYKKVKRIWPGVARELGRALEILASDGTLPAEYGAHELVNAGGNYNGHIDFHLSEGSIDVLVLYKPHRTNPSIRFVRMGCHDDLFQGEVK